MRLKRACLFMLGLGFLSGCSVRFAQLDTAQRAFASEADPRASAYAWVMVFNGFKSTVYPVSARGRNVVFANGNGLKLTWDGESITVIEGMPGAFGRYESGVEGTERWYAVAGQPVLRAVCTPARSWRLTESRSGWRQECLTRSGKKQSKTTHLVEFDSNKAIKIIETTLVPGLSPMRLVRLN